jgi:hypothetical protein
MPNGAGARGEVRRHSQFLQLQGTPMIRPFKPLRAMLAMVALCLATSAFAQYPNRPLTLVVP